MDDDRRQEAIRELYAADLENFLPLRATLAARAKAAGDRETAGVIAALRKPARAAFALNRLARTAPAAIADLESLGAALRSAQQQADGPALRALTARRRELVGELVDLSVQAAGWEDAGPAVRDAIAASLNGSLTDESLAAGLRAGALTQPGSWDGLSALPPGGSTGLTVLPGGRHASERPPAGAASPTARARTPDPTASHPTISDPAASNPTGPAVAAPRRRVSTKAPDRAALEDEGQARARSQARLRQRAQVREADRRLAVARQASEQADAALTRQTSLVRQLEEQLSRSRTELTSNRKLAGRAADAVRRAERDRELLDRPGPSLQE